MNGQRRIIVYTCGNKPLQAEVAKHATPDSGKCPIDFHSDSNSPRDFAFSPAELRANSTDAAHRFLRRIKQSDKLHSLHVEALSHWLKHVVWPVDVLFANNRFASHLDDDPESLSLAFVNKLIGDINSELQCMSTRDGTYRARCERVDVVEALEIAAQALVIKEWLTNEATDAPDASRCQTSREAGTHEAMANRALVQFTLLKQLHEIFAAANVNATDLDGIVDSIKKEGDALCLRYKEYSSDQNMLMPQALYDGRVDRGFLILDMSQGIRFLDQMSRGAGFVRDSGKTLRLAHFDTFAGTLDVTGQG